ncbi:N-acetyltransferase [Microbacterium sp. SORGH_AS_0888]|uniref:GNAT family N-acetyltransferase n=1 Tax=Microbacterium sp. SORGH_AS_0888 TaxID=3041791 RepID=UPI0027D7E784|nr:GNAT family N-acetyltransferase [Microbacterium sp. SORGH_AS_0888]
MPAHIGRLVVAPDLQGRGIGTTLLREAERTSGAQHFELFTGHLSQANIRLYEREGYSRARQVTLHPGVELVYLQKTSSRQRTQERSVRTRAPQAAATRCPG